VLELVAGISVLLLGLWVWLRLILAFGADGESASLSFLMLVVPGFVVGVGCYLQTAYRKLWPIALIFIGGVFNLIFTFAIASVFAYSGDRLGLIVVWADFGIVVFTLVAAFVHALMDVVFSHLAVSGKLRDR
jgi:hypothetical protein